MANTYTCLYYHVIFSTKEPRTLYNARAHRESPHRELSAALGTATGRRCGGATS